MTSLTNSEEPTSNVIVHIVLDESDDQNNRVYRQVREAEAGESNVIENIIDGKYLCPVRVIAFNVEKEWVRDVTVDIAHAVLNHARRQHKELSPSAQLFIETILGQNASMRALG